jgi:hypothetical protein
VHKTEVTVKSKDFDKTIDSFFQFIRDGRFVNSSSTDILVEVQIFLQLEENFSLPMLEKDKTMFTYIKNLESNLFKINPESHLEVRNFAIPIVKNIFFLISIYHKTEVNNRLKFLVKTTNKFVQKSPEIIFTKADKGNIT